MTSAGGSPAAVDRRVSLVIVAPNLWPATLKGNSSPGCLQTSQPVTTNATNVAPALMSQSMGMIDMLQWEQRNVAIQHVHAAMTTMCGTEAAAAQRRYRPSVLRQHMRKMADATTDAGAMKTVRSTAYTYQGVGPEKHVGAWVTVGAGETDGALVVGAGVGAAVIVGADVGRCGGQHDAQSSSPFFGRPSS